MYPPDAARLLQDKEMIQRQIQATDAQIDRLVYELYGLTEEEIKLWNADKAITDFCKTVHWVIACPQYWQRLAWYPCLASRAHPLNSFVNLPRLAFHSFAPGRNQYTFHLLAQ